jgi:hypothetical protein
VAAKAIFAVGGAAVGGLVGFVVDRIIQNTPPKQLGGER